MRASLRHIISFDVPDLPSWRPVDDDFAIRIQLLVGPEGGEGEESFDLILCNPGWLAERVRDESIVDPRHHLIVAKYDYAKLQAYLARRVAQCEGASWRDVAEQLGRLGLWEFEDYRSNPDP